MPDRYALTFPRTASVASNFAFTTTHQRVDVPSAGTIRAAYASATSVTSNATYPSQIDFYKQPGGPALASNTATTILVSPITVDTARTPVAGTIREAGARVAAGDQLELRTQVNPTNGEILNAGGTILIERDPD